MPCFSNFSTWNEQCPFLLRGRFLGQGSDLPVLQVAVGAIVGLVKKRLITVIEMPWTTKLTNNSNKCLRPFFSCKTREEFAELLRMAHGSSKGPFILSTRSCDKNMEIVPIEVSTGVVDEFWILSNRGYVLTCLPLDWMNFPSCQNCERQIFVQGADLNMRV